MQVVRVSIYHWSFKLVLRTCPQLAPCKGCHSSLLALHSLAREKQLFDRFSRLLSNSNFVFSLILFNLVELPAMCGKRVVFDVRSSSYGAEKRGEAKLGHHILVHHKFSEIQIVA